MPRCKYCGKEVYVNKRMCYSCNKLYFGRRKEKYDEAVAKYGEVIASNLKDIQAYVRKAEKQPLLDWVSKEAPDEPK